MTDAGDQRRARDEPGPGVPRRSRLARAVAVVALVTALIGAVGPADNVRTTYTWPPASLPSEKPARAWFAPLLLMRHEPDALAVDVPCSLAQPLAGAERPINVLSTAPNPGATGALSVTPSRDRLVFAVGADVLSQPRVETNDVGTACATHLRIDNRRWSVEDAAGEVSEGDLDAMPVVTGFFSALDLAAGSGPTITATTGAHETATTLRQGIAWALAVLAAVVALVLVSFEGSRPQSGLDVVRSVRTAARRAHVTDAVVGVGLVGWLALSPAFWDDGWVVARERAFSDSRGFSTFYNAFGVNLPLDYWVEWLQHWLTQSSTSVPLLRLPSLLCLASVWVLCRWSFCRMTTARGGRGDAALWALAVSFLAGAFAWGMTLRPEPVTALLIAAVMACAVRFAERETTAPVAVAAALVPLALTAHHTGIVALAPMIADSPRLVRWARGRIGAAVTIVTASTALLVTLLFVGSDLRQRLDDVRTTRESGITQSWRDELGRYTLLGEFPFASPLRRGSVALIALAILAYAIRRRRDGRTLLDLSAVTLALALVLLVLTPSKLPWHFGALIGLSALAVAAETARIREDGVRAPGLQVRPFLVVGAVVVAAAWSWGPREAWNPVDVRTVGWTPGLDALFPYSHLAVALPLVLLYGTALLRLARSDAGLLPRAAWSVASWSAPLLAAPLIIFTAGVLGADLVKTSSWTFTRQNLESIVGTQDCGLAEDVDVPSLDTARALPVAASGASAPPAPSWVPQLPGANVPRFALESTPRGASTPWFRLGPDEPFGLFVAGADSGRLSVEWGASRGGRIIPLGADGVSVVRHSIATDPWAFVTSSQLPERHSGAEAVRVTVAGEVVPGSPVAVSAPVTYETGVLARRLEQGSTLIHPNLLLYFPCAKQPRLDDGIVEVPRHIVWFDHRFQPHPYESTSTILGLQDLYPVVQLPTADSQKPPESVVVFGTNERIPGAQVAPPEVSTVVS